MYYSAHQTRYNLEQNGPGGIEQLCPFNGSAMWRGSHEELPWKRLAEVVGSNHPTRSISSVLELRYYFGLI
jgi:hypothetical protein